MLTRRAFATLLPLAPLAVSAAKASTSDLYSQARFDAAQKAGKPIVVHFWAGWCPTCLAQERALKEISAKEKYKDLVILSVDIDVQKDVMKAFGVSERSYLVAFKGKSEISRVGGITNRSAIETFVDKTVL